MCAQGYFTDFLLKNICTCSKCTNYCSTIHVLEKIDSIYLSLKTSDYTWHISSFADYFKVISLKHILKDTPRIPACSGQYFPFAVDLNLQ